MAILLLLQQQWPLVGSRSSHRLVVVAAAVVVAVEYLMPALLSYFPLAEISRGAASSQKLRAFPPAYILWSRRRHNTCALAQARLLKTKSISETSQLVPNWYTENLHMPKR